MKKYAISMMVLTCTLIGATTIFAETLAVTEGTGARGSTVTLQVTLGGNSESTGVAGASFTLNYDTTNLSLIEIRSDFFPTFSAQGFTPPNDTVVVGTDTYESALVVNTSGTMLAAARVNNNYGNGTMFELDFQIDGEAPEATYPVQIVQSSITNADAGYTTATDIPLLVGISADGASYPERIVPLPTTSGGITVTAGIVDTDGDGIDDNYEMQHFFSLDVANATSDYDKDGYTDLVEFSNDPTGTTYNPKVINTPGGPGYDPAAGKVVGTGDFDGDGHSDILLRHTSGAILSWIMADNGISIEGGAILDYLPAEWTVQATGDFNGDGRTDILLRHTSGAMLSWIMADNGLSLEGGGILGYLTAEWTIQDTGDFDGDSHSDILLRHTSGAILSWIMADNGLSFEGGAILDTLPNEWIIQGTGDFDGDGHTDLLLRHTSGAILSWIMADSGTSLEGGGILTYLPAEWVIQGTGDFDGDSHSDVLLRHTSGAILSWIMADNGISFEGGAILDTLPDTWGIHGCYGDFDGDTRSDILLRHTSGLTLSWIMADNGLSIEGGGVLDTLPNEWMIE